MKRIIYSIGHGNSTPEEFSDLLSKYNIRFLVDVRSVPFSRYCPWFNRQKLKISLAGKNIRYVYMGDLLGGRPADESVVLNGKINYDILKEKDYFILGLERLEKASSQNLRVCIMCSEANHNDCHREKLIASELFTRNILVHHIRKDGEIVLHSGGLFY